MSDAYASINQWLSKVISHVRYTPDRAAVRDELLANYEDHMDSLICAGVPKDLAEKRALEALGDPDETGALLNRIHSPLLGWAYRISQWMLCVVLIVLVFVISWHLFSPDIFTNPFYYGYPVPSYYEEHFASSFSAESEGELRPTKRGTATDGIRAGKYSFELEQASLKAFDNSDTGELTVILKATAALYQGPPHVLLNSIYAEDDLGNQYRFGYAGPYQGEFMSGELYISLVGRALGTYYIKISIPSSDKNMNWLDIVHEKEPNAFRLRLFFEEVKDDDKE
jgi:hypothetical protein